MDASTVLHQTQLSPGRHTWWARVPFAVAAIGGAIGLLTLKLLGADQFVVTLTAVAFMLLYCTIVAWTPLLRLREDQLADNCYYLGFLYTLFSLAYALREVALGGGVDEIIGNFGLALGSTIVGIMLRVVINQARKDVVETESDARMELAQAVIRLRVQIDDAVLAIKSFHDTTEQVARGAIKSAADTASREISETANTATEGIRSAAKQAAEALDDNVEKVGAASESVLESIQRAFSKFSEHTSQLTDATSGTVKGLKALLTRIEKIEAPNDIIIKRLEPAFATMDASISRLNQKIRSDEVAISSLETATNLVADRSAKFADGIQAISTAFQTTASSVGTARDRYAEHNEQLRVLSDETARLVALQRENISLLQAQHGDLTDAGQERLKSLVRAFRQYADELEVEIERTRKMSVQTADALVSLADTIAEKLTPERASEDRAAQGGSTP